MARTFGFIILAVAGLMILAALFSSPDRGRSSAPSGSVSSTTGIDSVGCAASVITKLDQLNGRQDLRARMVSALCQPDAVLLNVRVVASDGRRMVWEPKQGTDDLAWMLYHGRERR